MDLLMIVVVACAGFLIWSITHGDVKLARSSAGVTRSPISEAERILSARYARGEISATEYSRMLTILRR